MSLHRAPQHLIEELAAYECLALETRENLRAIEAMENLGANRHALNGLRLRHVRLLMQLHASDRRIESYLACPPPRRVHGPDRIPGVDVRYEVEPPGRPA